MKVGGRVRIGGLQSRPELNGSCGTVVSQKGERWVVELLDDATTKTQLALKEASLTVVVEGCVDAAAPALAPAGEPSGESFKLDLNKLKIRPTAMSARPGVFKMDYDWREVHPTNQPLPKGLDYMASLEEGVPTIARIPRRWKLDVFFDAGADESPYRMEVGSKTTIGEIQTALRIQYKIGEGERVGRPGLLCDGVVVSDPVATVGSAKLFGFKVTCKW
jgi:hypothetical protein